MKTVRPLAALVLILCFAVPAANAGDFSEKSGIFAWISAAISWIHATIFLNNPPDTGTPIEPTPGPQMPGYVVPTG
ncbi:MAG: hypothetical protein GY719_11570 [bacterium]|nr:hypothetical protein [bacterium]